jgi:hypothetical protein
LIAVAAALIPTSERVPPTLGIVVERADRAIGGGAYYTRFGR